MGEEQQPITTIQRILNLIEERDLARKEYTKYIYDTVNETVGAALRNLLLIPEENFTVDDIQVASAALIIYFRIKYNPSLEASPFLSILDTYSAGEPPIEVHRALTIGVPLTMIDEDANVIEKFLLDVASGVDPIEALPSNSQPEKGVDETPRLTEEQLQQLLFFQQTTKGTLQ